MSGPGSIGEVHAKLMAISKTLEKQVSAKIAAGHEAIDQEMRRLQAVDPTGSKPGNEVLEILLLARQEIDQASALVLVSSVKTAQWALHIIERRL